MQGCAHRRATPLLLRDDGRPADVHHSHRANASANLKTVRGQSAMDTKLAYAFQCGDIDFVTVQARAPEPARLWATGAWRAVLCA